MPEVQPLKIYPSQRKERNVDTQKPDLVRPCGDGYVSVEQVEQTTKRPPTRKPDWEQRRNVLIDLDYRPYSHQTDGMLF